MITLPKVVSLTTEDYLIALECAKLRWRDSLRDGRRDSVRPKSWQEALTVHHQGACAELAVARVFGSVPVRPYVVCQASTRTAAANLLLTVPLEKQVGRADRGRLPTCGCA